MSKNQNQEVFDEFTRNMGLCLIYFGNAERALFNVFSVALNSRNPKMAPAIYSGPRNFGARKLLVEAAVNTAIKMSPEDEKDNLQTEWNDVKAKMGTAFNPRNKVAHYFLYIWGTESGAEHVLQEGDFAWKDGQPPKEKPINLKELIKIQKDLEKARKSLANFYQRLLKVRRKKPKK